MGEGAFTYAVKGRRFTVRRCNGIMAVRFREPALQADREAVVEQSPLAAFARRFEVPREKFTIFPLAAAATAEESAAVAASIASRSEVARVAPVFELGAYRLLATDRVVVTWRGNLAAVERRLAALGLTSVEAFGEQRVFALDEGSDPLAITELLQRVEGVSGAEPDWVSIGRHPQPGSAAGVMPGPLAADTYVQRVIELEPARRLVRSSEALRIAVLDDGVDVTHPALSSSVAATYDAVRDGPLLAFNPWDPHGTACAGLALSNPLGEHGVLGVAAGCSLLVVRVAHSPWAGAPWATSSSIIRRGIDWAVDHDAAVLSCSWGGGAPSSLVLDGLLRARRLGRGGKGSVIVVAAGNHGGEVEFPGNVEGVLTISGTNQFDEFKTAYSRDGEGWWASSFGRAVSLAAPSTRLMTTDVVGAAGFGPSEYIATFNGTSGAAPLAAGAAALVMCANPALSEGEVREVLCSSADQVGGVAYVDGRSDQLGFGRLNVRRAVEAALERRRPGPSPTPPVQAPAPPFEAPLREPAAGEVPTGVILQAGTGEPRAAAYYLQTDDDGSFLLRAYARGTSGYVDELEHQSLVALARFAGRRVRAHHSERQDAGAGSTLWGVRLEDVASQEGGGLEAPPPGEVWLGPSELGEP